MRRLWFVFALLVLLVVTCPGVTYTFVATGPAVPGLSPLNENPPHPTSSLRKPEAC
jgi:hypothetical protein